MTDLGKVWEKAIDKAIFIVYTMNGSSTRCRRRSFTALRGGECIYTVTLFSYFLCSFLLVELPPT